MRSILFIFTLLVSIHTNAQREAYNWFFGDNAGIQFTDANTVTSVVGELSTIEGCASISNGDGDLLFYTDGITVYNRNHDTMLNGTGLLGNPSSTQSAIIVPYPNNDDLYYIFTVATDGNGGGTGGPLNYYTVDMTLDGGLGGVVQPLVGAKQTRLLRFTSEKIAAITKDCEGDSLWLITYANDNENISSRFDTIYAFEITSAGVNPTPVKTNVNEAFDRRGYLRISRNSKHIAIATVRGGLYLYDFNITTGLADSDFTNIPLLTPNTSPYGLEFSPNSKFLYIHAFTGGLDSTSTSLYQYNIANENLITINNEVGGHFRAALQIAPDGKIYQTQSNCYSDSSCPNPGLPFLSVINNPNLEGLACDFEYEGIYLTNPDTTSPVVPVSRQGLPPFVQDLQLESAIKLFVDGIQQFSPNVCEDQTFTLEIDELIPDLYNDAVYEWRKDGVVLPDFTSSSIKTPQSEPGLYSVNISSPSSVVCYPYYEIEIIYENYNRGIEASIVKCDGDNDGMATFYLPKELPTSNTTIQDDFFYIACQNVPLCVVDAINNPILLTYFEEETLENEIIEDEIYSGNKSVWVKKAPLSGAVNCSDVSIIKINLEVANSVIIDYNSDTLFTLEGCDAFENNSDGDVLGIFSFNDTEIQNKLFENNIIPATSNYKYSYFYSPSDAEFDENEIKKDETILLTNQDLYIKILNVDDYSMCEGIGKFSVQISEVKYETEFNLCDGNNDGKAIFNLPTEIPDEDSDYYNFFLRIACHENSACLLSLYRSEYEIKYYYDENFLNEITNPSSLETNSTTIYATKAGLDLNCNDRLRTRINLNVETSSSLIEEQDPIINIAECNAFTNNVNEEKQAYFSLSNPDINSQILKNMGLNVNENFNIVFYNNSNDAEFEINEIDPFEEFLSTEKNIFVKIKNTKDLNGCVDIEKVGLIVYQVDEVNKYPNNLSICKTTNDITKSYVEVSAVDNIDENASYNYVWRNEKDDILFSGGQYNTIELSNVGTFTFEVLKTYPKNYNNLAYETTCSSLGSVTIEYSSLPEFKSPKYNIKDASDNNAITVFVKGEGVYNFALTKFNNGISEIFKDYQESNEFKNLPPGEYIVYVKDVKEGIEGGCGEISDEVAIIGFPQYFTPNADGVNDYWNIDGAKLQPESEVYIYDRYGKILAKTTPLSKGWDGTYNGNLQPVTDYWFKAQLEDGREITGHFSLIR